MHNKVFIRVDGGSIIGFGHVVRCMALADILKCNFTIKFILKEIPLNFKHEIIQSGFEVFQIEDEQDWISVLTGNEIVVVDGYNFDDIFYAQIKLKKSVVVSIQDIYHHTKNIDVIINHLPGLEKKYNHKKAFTGPKYAIIRNEFLKAKKSDHENSNNYFISLGGTINHEQINVLVDLLKNIGKNTINILTTDYNKRFIVIKEGCQVYTKLKAKKIVELIDSSCYSFITPGMILYEVLSRNKRAVVGSLNDGQYALAEDFVEMKVMSNIGYWKDINFKNLVDAMLISNFNMNKVESIFDQNSNSRILDIFEKL